MYKYGNFLEDGQWVLIEEHKFDTGLITTQTKGENVLVGTIIKSPLSAFNNRQVWFLTRNVIKYKCPITKSNYLLVPITDVLGNFDLNNEYGE